MNRARKLELRKETLAELGRDDLARVVGGSGPSYATVVCVSGGTWCASDFQQCVTSHGCVPTLDDC